jgi:signal transduction histidine kinase
VDAWIDKEVLYIETEDDGIGFDPAVVQSKPGLGLKNLAIRSRMLGATLSIISWPGKGTRYRIWLPLNAR